MKVKEEWAINNIKKIYSKNEIPQNMSEDEAADFWSTHAMSEELLEDSILEEEILQDLVAQGLSGQVEEEERKTLLQRIERLEQNPESEKSWKSVRRNSEG